jgi:hypothetical protein
MPLYYVLYCGIGVNYRRLMPGKKFLGDRKLKLGPKPKFSTTVRYVNRSSNKGTDPEYLSKKSHLLNSFA